jgi:hypothetical protein
MSAIDLNKLSRYVLDLTWSDGELRETTRFYLGANEVFPFLKGRFAAYDDMLRLIEQFEKNDTITNLPSRIYAVLSHLNRLSTNVYYRGIIRGAESEETWSRL